MMHYMLGTSNQYVVRFPSSQNAWVWEAITLRSGSQNYDQYPTYNFFCIQPVLKTLVFTDLEFLISKINYSIRGQK